MNPGDLLLKLALVAALASAALFIPALRGRKAGAGAWTFGFHALAMVGATGLLWVYFVAHRFDIQYVARYSSRALPPELALAASWAGQEGSLLLWAALGAVVGIALLRQPGPLVAPAMFFVSVAQCFMLFLLLVRNPFVANPVVPADGMGLNPLLEDPWMVAHPPVLFVGYAAMMIPFALAGAAMVRQEYREWNRMVWPWALFAVVTLGTGIALGGIWAYKVLGWGGYWGWDPVENASLIPWLVAVALLHGLLIQRTTGALVRTNLLLAVIAWSTVLGGTYLTRSGVLQDFSVHSFTDAGLNAPLSTFLVGSFAGGLGLLLHRWRSIKAGAANWLGLSRESALWLGMVTVLVLGGLVAFGTSAPLITGLLGSPASVQTRFYSVVSIPLGIALVLLMGLAPALRWSRQHGLGWLGTLLPGLAAGAAAAVAAGFSGMRDGAHVALVGLAGFALAVNAVMTVRLFRRGWAYGSGYLAHAGVAVMVLGMVLTTALEKTQRVRLVQGEPAEALGYALTFRGERHEPRGDQVLSIHVEKPGWSLEATPRIVPSPRGDGSIRKPAIANRGELYIAPIQVLTDAHRDAEATWLAKGEEVVVADVGYTFGGFRMASAEKLTVFADITVRANGRASRVSPALEVGPEGGRPMDVEVDGLGRLSVAGIDADRGRVAVRLPQGTGELAVALVDVSTKPFINLVWIGALLGVLGTILAGLRRAAEGAAARTRSARPRSASRAA